MTQTLDGVAVDNYAIDKGVWRHVQSNYNFTDDTGAQAAYTIYTVTGDVLLTVFGLCQILLTGASTIELGIAGNTAALIAQTTGTDLDADETWQDAVPEVNPGVVDVFGGARQFVVADGADIIFTIAGADLTAGDIDFHVFWMPLSSDGALVAN